MRLSCVLDLTSVKVGTRPFVLNAFSWEGLSPTASVSCAVVLALRLDVGGPHFERTATRSTTGQHYCIPDESRISAQKVHEMLGI